MYMAHMNHLYHAMSPNSNLVCVYVFVFLTQGSKDGLCPLEKLEATRKKMKTPNEVHVINGGDHSFKIGKKHLQANNSTQNEAEDVAVKAIAAFISRSLAGWRVPLPLLLLLVYQGLCIRIIVYCTVVI